MTRKYFRRNNLIRGEWTEENLKLALDEVTKREITKHEAQRKYKIDLNLNKTNSV